MPPHGKKLGILISVSPQATNFHHAVKTAKAALTLGAQVYVYCIDDAVLGIEDPGLQSLCPQGLVVYACAYGAQRRNLPLTGPATFAGLTVVNDLMASTDRFLSFN